MKGGLGIVQQKEDASFFNIIGGKKTRKTRKIRKLRKSRRR